MEKMIAIGLRIGNSQRQVLERIAEGYDCGMRGEQKRLRRVANLRLLNKTLTFKYIAEKSETDEVYLSQIANGYVSKGRKSPRSLSDDYAEKIEKGLGLPPGWMDEDHEAGDAPAPAVAESQLEYLIGLASPRSRNQLERIAEAAADGRLSDADVALLETIAKRLSR